MRSEDRHGEDINYDYLPSDALKDVEAEESRRGIAQRRRSRFPSNEDIASAVREVSGGVITRYNVDQLYEEVLRILKEKGFDVSHVTPGRVERIVASMLRRRSIHAKLD